MSDVNICVPELSVVIPAYNAEKFITRTLDSLEQQTVSRDRYQIVVVDDGSKDNTLQICRDFAQKYSNILVVHQENGGVSAARNTGMENAEGKWISFVDSDDYVRENYVQTLLNMPTDAQYVIFDNYLERNSKQVLEKGWLQPHFDSYADKESVLDWICAQQLNAPWDKRFSLELIKKHHIRFPLGLQMGEDLLFNLAYVLQAQVLYVSGKAVYVHEDNLEGLCNRCTSLDRLQEYQRVYEGMLQLCTEGQLSERYEEKICATMLRVIASYAGKLHQAGLSKGKIASAFRNSKLVHTVLAAPTKNRKDSVRKFLLKHNCYGFCATLFK